MKSQVLVSIAIATRPTAPAITRGATVTME